MLKEDRSWKKKEVDVKMQLGTMVSAIKNVLTALEGCYSCKLTIDSLLALEKATIP